MPEGPEIRRVADQVRPVLLGHPVGVSLLKPGAEAQGELVNGQVVRAVEARGKALLIEFDNAWTVYCHSQLYGRWKVLRHGQEFKSRRQLRLLLAGPTHQARLYSATTIQLLAPDDLACHPFLSKLGPDLLDAKTSLEQLQAHLMQPHFKGRRLATLLLDQSAFCGSGNYLRSEILHQARVSPTASMKALAPPERQRLVESALAVPRRAYQLGGITNSPERVAALKKQRQPRRLYRHLVFGREGGPCYACGQPIVKVLLDSRRLYYCPGCQG